MLNFKVPFIARILPLMLLVRDAEACMRSSLVAPFDSEALLLVVLLLLVVRLGASSSVLLSITRSIVAHESRMRRLWMLSHLHVLLISAVMLLLLLMRISVVMLSVHLRAIIRGMMRLLVVALVASSRESRVRFLLMLSHLNMLLISVLVLVVLLVLVMISVIVLSVHLRAFIVVVARITTSREA